MSVDRKDTDFELRLGSFGATEKLQCWISESIALIDTTDSMNDNADRLEHSSETHERDVDDR